MIKLFACDLDGTLLNLFHTTDDKILAAIREITDAGAHVAAATGRTSVWYTDGGFESGTIEAICANGSRSLSPTSWTRRFWKSLFQLFLASALTA